MTARWATVNIIMGIRAILRVDTGFYMGTFFMRPTKSPYKAPRPLGLPETLTVAHAGILPSISYRIKQRRRRDSWCIASSGCSDIHQKLPIIQALEMTSATGSYCWWCNSCMTHTCNTTIISQVLVYEVMQDLHHERTSWFPIPGGE